MREDEKKVLIEWLIGQRDACDEIHGDDCKREPCITAKIALASLTAEPVLWEVKGIYCHSYEEAKSLYPNREPEPLFEEPEVP